MNRDKCIVLAPTPTITMCVEKAGCSLPSARLYGAGGGEFLRAPGLVFQTPRGSPPMPEGQGSFQEKVFIHPETFLKLRT